MTLKRFATALLCAAALWFAPASATTPIFYGDSRSATEPVFDVKFYGAKGDGSTDDTTAIQAALTAAMVRGGMVYFPQGQYKISAPLQVNGTGVVLSGAGKTVDYSSGFGSVIEPTYGNNDVFVITVVHTSQNGGMRIHDLSVNLLAQGATVTSGSVFHFTGDAASVTIDNTQTAGAWNIYNFDGPGGGPGQFYIHDNEGAGTKGPDFLIGNNASGLNIYHNFYGGDPAVYSTTKTSSFMLMQIGNSGQIDPFYIKDVDVELTSAGIQIEGNNGGFIVDGFIDGLLIDNTNQDADIRILTQGSSGGSSTSAASRLKIVNSWLTTSSTDPAIEIEANGTPSTYKNGADEIIIANSNISSSNQDNVLIGGGAADISLTGNMIYNSGACGVNIKQASHVLINGNRIGNVYGDANVTGICLEAPGGKSADSITISGNDLVGNTANAINLQGTITNLSVTGNLMSGYTTPISFAATPVGFFSGNIGYNSAAGAPSGPCSNGTTYTNLTGGSGTLFYGCYGNAWHAASTP